MSSLSVENYNNPVDNEELEPTSSDEVNGGSERAPGKRKQSSTTVDDEVSKRSKLENNNEEPEPSVSSRQEGSEGESALAKIKTEPTDGEANGNVDIKTETVQVKTENEDDQPGQSTSSVAFTSAVKKEDAPVTIKTEPDSGSTGVAPTVAGNTADDSTVSSSTHRPSCKYGIRCYRRNLLHHVAEAHPGDVDYRRPSYPAPPLGTPPCPYGNMCYRRNPIHFQQHSHPADFLSAENISNRLRKRTALNRENSTATEDTDSSSDDPFHEDCDSDADYNPNKDGTDNEDDLEFESQPITNDEYD